MPAAVPALIVTSVMPHPATSGGHKRTLRLMEAIARAGATPHLLTVDGGQPGAADELRARDWLVDVAVEAPPSLGSRLRQQAARRPGQYHSSVDRRLRELVPDAAFVQFEHPLNAYYWNAIGSTHSILSTHNVDSQVLLGSVGDARPLHRTRLTNRALAMRSAERRGARRADAVLAVSEHDRSYFSRFSDHVLIAANGVDAEFFDIPAELPDNHDILFFANYNYQPNADGIGRFLAEGWPRLAALDQEARLLLAGPQMPDGLAAQADREVRVERLGFVSDLSDLLRRSRVVLVPLWRGGGTRLKVLEALASARPVVGTPLGVEEIGVVNGRHAVIAETPAALADEVVELMADPERSMALSREGRALAETFRWERALEAAEQLYRGWTAERGP
ncbi:MAG TPA: glycosyltransferase family 4 protein [Solirubrobacteraceae bacterium]|jgi:polysaccharide biosynthesis protein PslH